MQGMRNNLPALRAKTPEPCEGCELRRQCIKHKLACRAAVAWANTGKTKLKPGSPNPYWHAGLIAPDSRSYFSAQKLAMQFDSKMRKAAERKAERKELADMARRVLSC